MIERFPARYTPLKIYTSKESIKHCFPGYAAVKCFESKKCTLIMDIVESVEYVRIPFGYALPRLVLSKMNNFNIQNIPPAPNFCGNPLFS